MWMAALRMRGIEYNKNEKKNLRNMGKPNERKEISIVPACHFLSAGHDGC